MSGSRREPSPVFAVRTRRQQLADLLRKRAFGFEELRSALQVPVRLLEEDLRHVERSARGAAQRLLVEPARCAGCGFVFRDRASRHFHPPGRCPRCRSEWIEEPRFRIEEREGRGRRA